MLRLEINIGYVPSYDIPMPAVHVHFRVESSPDSRGSRAGFR
jgi:hypothetical protein